MLKTPAELTVLIIDDNDYARALAETSLHGLGIGRIIEVADAADGMAKLHEFDVDVVLLDWYMPEINGAGFVRMVRAADKRPAIIVTTAYATSENLKRMQELGLTEILVKPFDRIKLHKMIIRVVRPATNDEDTPLAGDQFHL